MGTNQLPPADGQCRIGPYLLHLRTGELRDDGTSMRRITPQAVAVLRALGAAGGAVLSKDELFAEAWPGRVVGDAALASCIQELRDALGDDARQPRFIATLHRRGYRLLVPWSAEPTGPIAPVGAAAVDAPIGRARELAALDAALRRMLAGQRQVVFIAGEAGIGKSTLLGAFLARVAARGDITITRGQCVEQHGAGEPYMPLLEATGRLADGARRAPVLALLRRAAPSWLAQLPAPVEPAEQAQLLARTAGVTRERMLREWCDAIERLAAEQPLLIALEDLHWSDASTLDAINALARRQGAAALMLVATGRSQTLDDGARRVADLRAELQLARCATCIEPGLWSRAEVEQFVAAQRPALAVGRVHTLAAALYERSEGNPLFAASLIGLWDDDGAAATTVPADLRSAIRRQLARLAADERGVLETAAVVGARFDSTVVAVGGAEHPAPDVERVCLDLAERQAFIDRIADPDPGTRFAFRHTLYREQLYAGLTAQRRTELHRRIGRHLETLPGAEREVAQLAHHFDLADDPRRAARYHQLAGELAARRSAPREATRHLQRALELLARLPADSERTQAEVGLLIALGAQQMALHGWGAPEVEQTYSRAQALCEGAATAPALFPALWGLWLFRWGRGDLDSAHALCGDLERLADRSGEPMLRLQCHHAAWATCVSRNEYAAAVAHARAAASVAAGAADAADAPEALRFGNHDALVCGDSMAAVALTFVGDAAAARASSERALRRAQQLQHPFSSTLALYFASMLHQLLDEPERCRELAEASQAQAVEQGFELFRGWSDATAGWAMAATGDGAAGVERVRSGIATARKTGTAQLLPYLAVLLADGCVRAQQWDAARAAVEQGLQAMGVDGGGLHRGDLLRIAALLDPERRAQLFEQADEVARRLSSPWLHERVARSRGSAST